MSDLKPEQPQQENPKALHAATEARLKEIGNVNRIVTNAIALINDVDIKGAHAQPVTEIIGWLTGFSQSLTGQIQTLESTLPKKEAVKAPELKAVPTAKAEATDKQEAAPTK